MDQPPRIDLSAHFQTPELFNSFPISIIIQDAAGQLIFANPTAQRILGLSFEQMSNCNPGWDYHSHHHDWQIIADDGLPIQIEDLPFLRCLYSGEVLKDVVVGFQKPGTGARTWIKVSCIPLSQNPGEAPNLVLSILEDLTERKISQEIKAEADEELRSAIDTIPAMLWSCDPQGSITHFNQSCLAYTGLTQEQVLGIGWMQSLHPDSVSITYQKWAEAAANHSHYEVEQQLRSSDGQYRWFLSRANPVLDTQDQVVQWYGVNVDINDRKKAELALQQAQTDLAAAHAELEQRVAQRTLELSRTNAELQQSNRAKSEFMAMMSHELRTPLNAVMGLSEALLEGIYGKLTNEQAVRLETIYESGSHLLKVITDILDLTKIETGRFDLRPSTVDIRALTQNCLLLIKESALKKQIQLSLTVENGIKLLLADEMRLKQMLLNLLSNAIKFTPAGGIINLEVTNEQGGDVIRFSVRDTGIGIPPDKIHLLFQPFVQVDASLSRNYEGTGLGLALARRLVEQMGGSVGVESQLGLGSCFWFCIPFVLASPEAQSETATSSAPSTDGDKRLILIAEDNRSNLGVIHDYLLAHAYRIITAVNGNEVLERTKEFHPDLILMDIQMPQMDGLEAARALRRDTGFAHTPIIALTALVMPGDREKCLEAGADDYLEKPISLRLLLSTLEKHLQPKHLP